MEAMAKGTAQGPCPGVKSKPYGIAPWNPLAEKRQVALFLADGVAAFPFPGGSPANGMSFNDSTFGGSLFFIFG